MNAESAPLWSILIATLASRREMLAGLLAVLLPQCEDDGRVEVLACHDNGERPLPVKRQVLLDAARGEWVSFVDDDDMVEPDFVETIARAMTLGVYLPVAGMAYGPVPPPDFIAFDHRYYVDGVYNTRIDTGIHHAQPGTGPDGSLIRPVTHVNPVRRALTAGVSFGGTAPGEDRAYVMHVWPRLKTQVLIGRPLYHYRHRSYDSVQRALAPHTGLPRLEVRSPCFTWVGAL
jgi:glycosyltransferase involved in cell wall biosynthesis